MTFTTQWTIYRILLIAIIGNSLNVFAQNPDSLREIAIGHVREDTTKVRLYAMAGKAYRSVSADSVFSLASRGSALAGKLHFDNGKAECLVYMGLACLIRNDLDSGAAYTLRAIAIYQNAGDSADMELPFFYLGAIYYNQTKYSQAISAYMVAARLSERSRNYKQLGTALTNLGSSYSALANYPEALNYFLKGLKVWEQTGSKPDIAISLGNIGQLYADMGQNKKAIDYVKQSIAIQAKTGDASGLIINYENEGGVYLAMGDYANSIAAFKQALAVADTAGPGHQKTRIYCNIGEAYVESGDYDNAYDVYQKALADPEIMKNPAIDGMTHRGLGRVFVKQGRLQYGISHLLKAIAVFKDNDLRRELVETADALRSAYTQQHDYAKALEYTNLYFSYRDSLYNASTDMKVQQAQFDYELRKKQDQIALLNKNEVIARITKWSLIGGLVSLTIIIILLYRSRQREKHTREMIARQAASLDELNRFKDKIFSVLSHDLSGPVNALSTTMSMLDENLISPQEFNELKPEVNKQLTGIAFLLDNLLKWSRNYVTAGKGSAPVTLQLHDLAAQSIALMESNAAMKKITVVNDIAQGITATGDAGQIDIVVRNLLSNALKFTQAGGSVTLAAIEDADTVRLTVTDTGIGMTPEQLRKLFTTATDNSTYGTGGEKGIGLGLLLCYDFVKANNGSISVASEVDRGTTFTVVLPG